MTPEQRAERRRTIVTLVEQGVSKREVCRRLGIGKGTVYRALEAEGVKPPTNVPPAEVGNTRALKHGLDSQRVTESVVAPRAGELAPGIIEANPHLDAKRDGAAVLRYALKLARLERAYEWLAEQDDDLFKDRDQGIVHGLYGRVEMWERSASADEERLAVSPRERTRLKLDTLGVARGLGGGELDFSAFTEEELEVFVRLREKAAASISSAEEDEG